MKLNEWVNNYIKEVTHSHEYEDMSQMGEDENDPQEISVGNYQTKYFHVCPGASKLYGDIESKGVDMDMAERSARLQDALYFVEEHIQRDGYKPERDYVMVAKNIAKNIMKMAEMMGLEKEHDYIQGHVDTIEKVVKEKGLEERVMELTEENVPTNPSKWSYYKSQAKKKFDVYPSAYANAWAAKQYKAAGGGWRTKKKESVSEGMVEPRRGHKYYQLIKDAPVKYIESQSNPTGAKGVLFHNKDGYLKGKKGAYVIDYYDEHFYVDLKSKFATPIYELRDQRELVKYIQPVGMAPEYNDWKKYMRDIPFTNESDLKGQLAGDSVQDIIKSIGSRFVSGEIKNTKRDGKTYIKLKDEKFGSGVVKILKSRFGIDAKVDYYGGKGKVAPSPSVSFFSDTIIDESVNEASVGDFEIGDFVHFKSKNKTGMVVSVKGSKVTINTPKGKITSDVKDVKVLHQDNVNEAYVIFYAKKKGDKPSQAAYRDKDMAVKFEKDLKKDGYITMMVNKKIKGVDESVNEGVEPQIKKIAYYTGTRPEAVEDFVSKHGLNITKLLKFVEKGKLPERMAIVSALAGRPGNPVQKKIIKQFSESINEDYYKSASDAADAARKYAEKKGFEIDEDDWQTQIAMGGKHNRLRPGVGKTHSFSVGLTKNGKPQRKALNISLYGMDSGKFELTSYIN
jgi:hypothetical protein